MSMALESSSNARQRLREMAFNAAFLTMVIAVRLTWGTLYLAIPIAILAVAFAYAIASVDVSRGETSASAADRDSQWAHRVLNTPLWLELAAAFVHGATFAASIVVILFWDMPLWQFLDLRTMVPISAAPLFFVMLTLAERSWERRYARRILQRPTT